MASDQNNNIEALLRAYARKRREEAGAPVELDAVTRRLLQAEAARVSRLKAPPRANWRAILPLLWPRMAYALGLLVVLAFGVWVAIDPSGLRSRMQMAKSDEAVKPMSQSAPASARPTDPAVAEPPTTTAPLRTTEARAKLAEDAKREKDLPPPMPTAPVSPPAPAVRSLRGAVPPITAAPPRSEVEKPGRRSQDESSPPPGSPRLNDNAQFKMAPGAAATHRRSAPAAPKADTDSPAVAMRESVSATSGPPTIGQTYQGLAARPAAPAARYYFMQPARSTLPGADAQAMSDADLLSSFQLVQRGNSLQILDHDGSVYEGEFEMESEDPGRAGGAGSAMATNRMDVVDRVASGLALQAELAPAEKPVAFRVVGTNRTSGQFVVITGALSSEKALADGAVAGRFAINSLSKPAQPGKGSPALVASAPVLTQPQDKYAEQKRLTNEVAGFVATNAPAPLRLSGKAVINGTNELVIDAQRVLR